MVNVTIDSSIRERCPSAVLGLLECLVDVNKSPEGFLAIFNKKIEELSKTELSQANKRDKIQAARAAYKAMGKDANRYRNSAEAMCRRISKERGLYYINNVVDINNYISVSSGYSMGTYDRAGIRGDIIWMRAPEGAVYKGIGKGDVNIEFLPALFDDEGAFGNPTSDSTRAMVTDKTEKILMVFYAFDGEDKLPKLLGEAEALLKAYAGGRDIAVRIVK